MAIKKSYKFSGFGFPVTIKNAPVKKTSRGDEVVDVDFNKIEAALFVAIAEKPARLSGAEVKFLRNHMNLTQVEFAGIIGVERSSIAKWEKKALKSSGMNPPTEFAIRFHALRYAKADLNTALLKVEVYTKKNTVGKPIEILAA
jgi:putative transcriptional regulator